MISLRFLLSILSGLALALLSGCAGPNLVQKQEVQDIPATGYKSILRLNNPDGAPDRTLAGVVHITGQNTVCTDFPRQESIRSLSDLDSVEQHAFRYFQHYTIGKGAEIYGYVSVPIGYRTFIWHNDHDPACSYKVQVVLPNESWRRVDRLDSDKSPASW